MKQNRSNLIWFWIILYLIVIFTPLFVMFFGNSLYELDSLRKFAVACGFIGLSLSGFQFLLAARLRILQEPFGNDLVYYFHHTVAILAFVLILVHPVILLAFYSEYLNLFLNIAITPLRMRLATFSVISFAFLALFSLWQKKFKFAYHYWRLVHGILAFLGVGLAATHIFLVGNYLSTPLMKILWIIYVSSWVLLWSYRHVIRPYQLHRKPYEVVAVEPETADVNSLIVKPLGHAGFDFLPGQFVWISVWQSPFFANDNPFSISSSSTHPERVRVSIKALGDFTNTVPLIQPGQKVYVDGAYGVFSTALYPESPGFVMIAGGIGITPMMSMLETMADEEDTRPVYLFYGNNTVEEVVFFKALEQLKSRMNLIIVHVIFKPGPDWQGEQGFINREVIEKYLMDANDWVHYHYFLCGPPPMMNAVEKILVDLNIAKKQIESERFDLGK
jgi:3-phenylpropionate/trans-cinnamate dioxygenase ferredoxin reductase subunit